MCVPIREQQEHTHYPYPVIIFFRKKKICLPSKYIKEK